MFKTSGLRSKADATDLNLARPAYRIEAINTGRYVLTQERLAERYNTRTRRFDCWQQLICMGFTQLTWSDI